jgi:ribonucleotide reductase alpha subunit
LLAIPAKKGQNVYVENVGKRGTTLEPALNYFQKELKKRKLQKEETKKGFVAPVAASAIIRELAPK